MRVLRRSLLDAPILRHNLSTPIRGQFPENRIIDTFAVPEPVARMKLPIYPFVKD
jgi:hypothetical protein